MLVTSSSCSPARPRYFVTPPSVPGASWLRRRMLANVPRVLDRLDRVRVGREVLEERRLLDVRAVLVPLEQLPAVHRNLVPLLVPLGHVHVLPLEHVRREGELDRVVDLLL